MRRLLAALVIGLAATFGGAQAASAPADPIVGTWSYGGGTVAVRQTGSTFEGIVRSPIRFTQCTHKAGERMWTIVRTARGYAGRQFSWGAGIGCRNRIWVSANWKLERGGLHFWVAERSSIWPQRCGVETLCFRLARRAGPAPAPSTSEPGAPAPAPPPTGPVSFRFTVEGKPLSTAGLGDNYDTTVADGRGSVTAAGAAKGTSLVFHVHKTGDGELIELDVTGVRQRAASKLTLELSVRSATVHGCAAGSRGTLTLVDGPPDEVTIAVCGRSSRYRNAGVDNVRVTFTRP
jgi:hypothetical protein